MNKVNYDRQALTDYLLGSLPEPETEHFDELSIMDDRFAEALEAAENELVDSFVRGELSDAETEKFESHYLASPLRRGKAEFAGAFQIFAEQHIAAANEAVSAEEEPKPKKIFTSLFSVFNIFTAPNPFLQWGVAAVILVMTLFGGWILLKNARFSRSTDEFQAQKETKNEENSQILSGVNVSTNTAPEKEIAKADEKPGEPLPKNQQTQTPPVERAPRKAENQTAPPKVNPAPPKITVASFILVPPLRGSNQIQTVQVSPETDYAAVQLELESDDYAAYRVALVDRASGKNLWQSSGRLKTTTSGETKRLRVRFPAKLLKPQIYSLSVSGIAADGTAENISDYSFRVVR